MRKRAAITLGLVALFPACVPGSPVYLGAPFATVRGTVYSLEDRQPVPGAEVCMMASDTSCVRTDRRGFYKLFNGKMEVVNLSFRIPGSRPARIDSVYIEPPGIFVLNCTLSTIMTLSSEPGSCREAID